MKSRLNGRSIVCLLLMALAAAAFLKATQWPLSAKLFPMVVSVPLFVFALIEFAINVWGGKEEPTVAASAGTDAEAEEDPLLVRKHATHVFLWCLAFFVLTVVLGFSIAVPLFVFLYLKPYCKESWLTSAVLTGVAGICFYGLFIKILNVHFEDGLLQQGLRLIGLA